MNKQFLVLFLPFLLFLVITPVVNAGGNSEYYDPDYGLIVRLYAPFEIEPQEDFSILFEVYPALRAFDLNITVARVELRSLTSDKSENLLFNFILEKGDYEGPPAIVKNITFDPGYGLMDSPSLVECVLELYYAPVNSTSFKHVYSESILTWSTSSTYQELRTEVQKKEDAIEAYQRNTEMFTGTTIALVGAIGLLSVKYLRKTHNLPQTDESRNQ